MKRKQITWLHIIVWALLLTSNLWTSYAYGRDFHNATRNINLFLKYFCIETGYLTLPIFCFYGAYGYVAPRLFVSKKFLTAFLFFLLIVAGAIALRYSLEYYFFLPVFGFDNYGGHPWPAYDFATNVFFYYFPRYFMYGLMYFFAENWYKTRHQAHELQKERAAAELAFLRSQVNPHFLFNTINDIYSLTYQKSDQAPAALLKLSDMLRYMLRDGNELMPLRDEVKYLESLVELQRISAKGSVYIDFKVEGYVGEQKIASLLFVSFVENAFKHGILTGQANPVRIHLTVQTDSLIFFVSNQKNSHQKDQTGGIGLNNVRRRLELMYPGKHNLKIDDNPHSYDVQLTLLLNS